MTPNRWPCQRKEFSPSFKECVITSVNTFYNGNGSCPKGYPLLKHERQISHDSSDGLLNCRQTAANASHSESLSVLINRAITDLGSTVTIMRSDKYAIAGDGAFVSRGGGVC